MKSHVKHESTTVYDNDDSGSHIGKDDLGRTPGVHNLTEQLGQDTYLLENPGVTEYGEDPEEITGVDDPTVIPESRARSNWELNNRTNVSSTNM